MPGEAQDQRLQCGGRLESQVKETEYLAAGTSAPADPLCKLSPEVAALPPIGPCQAVNAQMTCEACLERFVQELDGLLAGKPHSGMDLDVLLMRTLPLKACNVEEALKIARKSRYFTSLFERADDYGIAFSDAGEHPYSGSSGVSFSILKQSGNSDFGKTHVKKW